MLLHDVMLVVGGLCWHVVFLLCWCIVAPWSIVMLFLCDVILVGCVVAFMYCCTLVYCPIGVLLCCYVLFYDAILLD